MSLTSNILPVINTMKGYPPQWPWLVYAHRQTSQQISSSGKHSEMTPMAWITGDSCVSALVPLVSWRGGGGGGGERTINKNTVLRGRLTVMFLNKLKQYHYFNEVWIVVNTAHFTCTQSNMKYWIQYVRDHQRAGNIHSVLKIINLTLSQYTIASPLILWILKCVNFVFNVCSFCL